jgi:RimJ/RimL family protein N-acetyltransferase
MNKILETKRLILREIDIEDAAAMFALNNDPDVVRYTDERAFESLAAAAEFVSDYIRKNGGTGFGRWMIVQKDTQQILGWCGLKLHRDTNEVDLSYRLFKKYWGQGIASEAASACLRYGFENLNLNRIYAEARQENEASIQVMRKCGMQFLRKGYGCSGATVVYEKYKPLSDQIHV